MMLKNNYVPILKQWVKGLINVDIDLSLIDPHFVKEDGMNLSEYLIYEQEQFTSLSHIYDLTENFDINIIAEQTLEQLLDKTKILVYYYLINHLNKIVCKMTTTLLVNNEDKNINNDIKITGNNYSCQLVPKYNIDYDLDIKNTLIRGLSLAIKVEKSMHIQDIICPELTNESLGQGANFTHDHFYHARFSLHEDEEFNPNQYYQFYLKLEKNNQSIIEKRKIFFDIIKDTLIPFEINQKQLSIIDAHYPVHLTYSLINVNNKNNMGNNSNIEKQNIEYPRNQTINLEETQNIIITDCLDNDWNIIK